jgi:hypothetical protein
MAKDKVTEENLKALGIDPSEPDQAVEKLRSLQASGNVDDARIAAVAGNIVSPAAAQLLAEMEGSASGPLRREVRRSLFKLRQHGIEPPSGPETAPSPAAGAASTSVSALISPVDPEGARLVWLLKPRVQGGLSRLQGLTSDSEGLVGANIVHLSRRELREEVREIERRTSVKLADADYRLADYMLCEAYRRTPPERVGQVGTFLAVRAEILADPMPTEFRHPIYDEFAATLDQEPSVELLNVPELGGWVVAEADLKPYLAEAEEIRQSPLVLNQYQQQERLDTLVGRGVAEFFADARGELMRRRLEDTAYYLARTGRHDGAQWAASAAARIRDHRALERIPFFVQYVRRSMDLAVYDQQKKTEQQPRLIMTPAEVMRAQAAARARRLQR